MKARIKNVGEWKAIVTAISDMVDDAMFIVNDDGITFRGMDASHVALLDVTFPRSSFEYIDGKTSFFGLHVADFKHVLNTASNEDIIELLIENEKSMTLKVDGTLKMEYNIRLIEKTETNTPIPKTDYTAKVSLNPSTLNRIFTNLQYVSDYVTIKFKPSGVQFSGSSEMGDAKIDIDNGSPELNLLESTEETTSVYSLEYMTKIIRDIGKASKKVNMECASKNPIHIQFEMPSMARVEYYLAPRIEN